MQTSFNEFESFVNSSISTDLSLEIGNIISKVEESRYRTSGPKIIEKFSVPKTFGGKSSAERVVKLERDVAVLSDKLGMLINAATVPDQVYTVSGNNGSIKLNTTYIPQHSPSVDEAFAISDEASEKLASKLNGVMKDLDGLKNQMESFYIDQDAGQMRDEGLQQQASAAENPEQQHHSFSSIPINVRDYIALEVKRQFDAYRDKHLANTLANAVAQIESRLSEKMQALFIANKNGGTDPLNDASFSFASLLENPGESSKKQPDLQSSSLYVVETEDPLQRKFFAGKHEAERQFLHSRTSSGRSTPKAGEEKRVRWEEEEETGTASRATTPVSDVSKESQDADFLLQKLRDKIEQKARLVRQMESKQQNKQLKKKSTIAVIQPSKSLSRPTTSSQLKKKAFY